MMDLDMMRLNSREEFQTWLAKEVEVRDELEAMIGGKLGLDEPSLDKHTAKVKDVSTKLDEAQVVGS